MNSKCDVLIIGGGPVGLSCAYYLLKSGRSVTILDADQIGKGSGAGNAGHIVPSHIIPLAAPGVVTSALKWMLDPANSPFGMKVSLDPRYLSWLLQFTFACTEANVQRAIPPLFALGQLSARNFAQIVADENFDCHYSQTGFLNIYKSEATFQGAKHEAEFVQKHGIPVSVYDKARVHEVEPAALEDVIGGVHYIGDAHLNPARFLQLLAERVRSLGADLRDHTPVTGFEAANGRITKVKTNAGEFEAEQVILAAGAFTSWVVRDLRLKIPVQPARGFSLTAAAIQNMPRQALILGDRRVAVSPLGDLLRITGRLEVGQMDLTPDPLWIRRLQSLAREYLRIDEQLDIKETWAGLRPVAPDGMPIIGRSPRHTNLVIATGHAMLGLSLGPGTGQVVSELLNSQPIAFDITTLGLERF